MSLLAIDIGSSACKAVVFDASGHVLAQHSAAYPIEFPRPSFAEARPESFWRAVCEAASSVTRELNEPVHAMGISSHGESFVPVNASGEPAAPAILNQDGRAAAEAEWCEQTLGRQRAFQITGHVMHPMYPLGKILWMRKNQPEVFSATSKFVTVIGYVLLRMGLPPLADYSLASRYFAFDIMQRQWSNEILDRCGLSHGILPETAPAGTIAGKLSAEIAGQLGLKAGTPVVLGGHDQPCGAIGSGVIDQGSITDSIGTYECLTATSDRPNLTEANLASSLNTYCHVVPGKFVTLAYFPSSIMLKWFHDLLYRNGSGGSESAHFAAMEREAKAGPSGLLITPHLIGTCNPEFNPHARGVIFGLTPATDSSDVYKGIMEGIACEFARLATILEKATGDFGDIRVAGGGSRSQLGLRLRAALTGKRLHTMECSEAVCLGSAILAAVAVGDYASIPEAVHEMVHETGVVEPDSKLASSYEPQLMQYERVRELAVGMHFHEKRRGL